MSDIIMLFLNSFWEVLGLMAPYLLFGYLIAGVLSVLVTATTVERHLGGNSFVSTFKAALFGMPLPLCSCGVIPVTASLRKHGAGKGAVASFLISTPTTGVDSILAAWALMGPVFAVYRAVMSVLLGVLTGFFVNIFGESDIQEAEEAVPEVGSCCSEDHDHSNKKQSVFAKIMHHGFISLPKDLGRPLLIGILIASLISALIQAEFINQFLGAGIGTMLIMLVVGIPLYVCATASIPLALGFMALGASPGAAFVFLIAGPATNAATITVLWKMIGKRSTIILLVCMFFGALAGGLLLDLFWNGLGVHNPMGNMHEEGIGNWFYSLSAVILIFVQCWSLYGGKIISWFKNGEVVQGASCCGCHEDTAPVSACCSASNSNINFAASSCCNSGGSGTSGKESSCCSDKDGPKQENNCCSRGGVASDDSDDCCSNGK